MQLKNNDSLSANGTGLVRVLEISYQELVEVFGESAIHYFAGTKVDAEWKIMTPYGVATIYNYKTGHNYLGHDGRDVHDITGWHFGGSHQSANYLLSYLFLTLRDL